MMYQRVNLVTCAILPAVNKVILMTVKEDGFFNKQQWAAVTHFTMTQYSFKKAPNLYPVHAEAKVGKDLEQLHSRDAFTPQDATKLTPWQKMALESIMAVKEKRDKLLEGRFMADGRKHWSTIEKDESASPTAGLDSIFVADTTKKAKDRDVAVVDLSGAYLSATWTTKRRCSGSSRVPSDRPDNINGNRGIP